MKTTRRVSETGFTLIETLVVLLLLGVAAVVVTTMQAGIGSAFSTGTSIQTRAVLQGQCAELILARRRENGWLDAINFAQNPKNCVLGGESVTVLVDTNYTGSGCLDISRCALITFSVSGVQDTVIVLPDYEL